MTRHDVEGIKYAWLAVQDGILTKEEARAFLGFGGKAKKVEHLALEQFARLRGAEIPADDTRDKLHAASNAKGYAIRKASDGTDLFHVDVLEGVLDGVW
jgi:hypothetical protein